MIYQQPTPQQIKRVVLTLFNGDIIDGFYSGQEYYDSQWLLPIPKNNPVVYWCEKDEE